MSFFEQSSQMEFSGNRFTLIQGGVHYSTPTEKPPAVPVPVKEPLTHVFKKTVVLKQAGFVPMAVAFVKNNSQVIAVSQENPMVSIWDLNAEEESLQTPIYQQPLMEDKRYYADFATVSADGSRVVVGSGDSGEGRVLLWDIVTKITSSHIKNFKMNNAALSHDGSKMVTFSFDLLRLWNLRGEDILEASVGGGSTFPVAFSPNGKKLISVGEGYRVINTWDTPTGKSLEFDSTLQYDYKKVHDSIVKAVAFSPVGKSVALGFEDGKIILMDTETGEVISQPDHFKGHDTWITGIAFSADGKWFASCSRDGSVRVWGVESGQPISSSLQGHQSAVLDVALSPDNRRIVSVGENGKVIVWTLQ